MGMAPTVAPVVMSLNQSALYLGIAIGAAAGGVVLKIGSAANTGWVGGLCLAAATAVHVTGLRSRALHPQAVMAGKSAVEMG